jgi:hypothetical protein
MLAYNVVRREASKAAQTCDRAPHDVSFKFAFEFIAAQLIVMAGALSAAHTPRRLGELRGSISNLFIEKRPRPSRPRRLRFPRRVIASTGVLRPLSELHCASVGPFFALLLSMAHDRLTISNIEIIELLSPRLQYRYVQGGRHARR